MTLTMAKDGFDVRPEANPTRPHHCLVLVSGGVDSAACVDFYLRQQFTVGGLHVTYGQPSARQEITAAHALATHFAIPLTHITLTGAVAKPDGQVLGRNAFLLFTALGELDVNAGVIALGVHAGTPYYDCSANFMASVQTVVDGQCNGSVQVAAPFLDWTKRQIWDYCVEKEVPIELTYSCERGQHQPCGGCLSCRDLENLVADQNVHGSA